MRCGNRWACDRAAGIVGAGAPRPCKKSGRTPLGARRPERAQQLGRCELTLEVLTGNPSALRSYAQAGFKPYVLDPVAGAAILLQKLLP